MLSAQSHSQHDLHTLNRARRLEGLRSLIEVEAVRDQFIIGLADEASGQHNQPLRALLTIIDLCLRQF